MTVPPPDVFSRALAEVLRHEGGFADHPKDPGGATNFGVTQRVYDAWRKDEDRHPRSVRYITQPEVAAIYRERYWVGPGSPSVLAAADKPTLAIVSFDWAVNAGLTRSTWYTQSAVGAIPDGIWGDRTLDAIRRADDAGAAARYVYLRMLHYRTRCGDMMASVELGKAGLSRVAPKPREDQRVFLKGWLARLRNLSRHLALPIHPHFAKGTETQSLRSLAGLPPAQDKAA